MFFDSYLLCKLLLHFNPSCTYKGTIHGMRLFVYILLHYNGENNRNKIKLNAYNFE